MAAMLYSQMIIPSLTWYPHSAARDVTAMLMCLGSSVCTQTPLRQIQNPDTIQLPAQEVAAVQTKTIMN